MTFDAARRMLWGHYHGQPVTTEGAAEFQHYLMIMARKVLQGTPQENEDAAAEFSLTVLDRTKYPTWLRLAEDELWKAVSVEYHWFLRRTRAERFAENYHDICSAGQIAQPRPDESQEPLSYVTTSIVAARLPNTADIDKARNLFLDALDSYNSTEWPPNDRRALVKHLLLFYDKLNFEVIIHKSVGRDQRWSLQRRYSLKQKEIAALFGLKPDVASRLLKKAREERRSSLNQGEPLDGKLRAVLVQRLELIIKNPARYQS